MNLISTTDNKTNRGEFNSTRRLYVLVAATVMLLSLLACATTEPESSSDMGTVSVVNSSTQTICFLYTSPSTSEDYGEDRLGSGTIEPGGSFTLINIPPGANDFLAENCDEVAIEEEREVSVTAGQTITWTVND